MSEIIVVISSKSSNRMQVVTAISFKWNVSLELVYLMSLSWSGFEVKRLAILLVIEMECHQ